MNSTTSKKLLAIRGEIAVTCLREEKVSEVQTHCDECVPDRLQILLDETPTKP